MGFIETYYWFYLTIDLFLFVLSSYTLLKCCFYYYQNRTNPWLRSRRPRIACLQIIGGYGFVFSRFFNSFQLFYSRKWSDTPIWFRIIDVILYKLSTRTFAFASIWRIYSIFVYNFELETEPKHVFSYISYILFFNT